jgi:hypothetical protein
MSAFRSWDVRDQPQRAVPFEAEDREIPPVRVEDGADAFPLGKSEKLETRSDPNGPMTPMALMASKQAWVTRPSRRRRPASISPKTLDYCGDRNPLPHPSRQNRPESYCVIFWSVLLMLRHDKHELP